ncbi:MAG: hypothetical protein ACLSUW_05320 [Akkermansia sp.]
MPHLAARFAAKEAVAKPRNGTGACALRMWRWCAAMREFLPFFCTGCGSDRPGAGHYGLVPDHDPFSQVSAAATVIAWRNKSRSLGRKERLALKEKGSYFPSACGKSRERKQRHAAVEGSGTAA